MQSIFFEISIIVACAALLGWLALQFRQPIIVAYVLCGVLAGPWGLGLVRQVDLLDNISRIGITLLLFLAGMVLHPQRLALLFRKASVVTLGCCIGSLLVVAVALFACGLGLRDALLVGGALMFSSTILVVKLLPTTTLHQRHMGSVCIAILIAQDLLAVLALLVVGGGGGAGILTWGVLLPLKGALFVAAVVLLEQYVLRRMMARGEAYHEILYMLCLGWCLGVATVAHSLGLSYEVGAFIAGVALARSQISRFLSDQLQPMRDFFLMFFFFVLGAKLDVLAVRTVGLHALVAGVVVLAVRPVLLYGLFRVVGERPAFSREVGIRMGQGSEFGMILAIAMTGYGLVSEQVSQLIQFAVIFTMVVSSYIVVLNYPSPLGFKRGLKQD